MKLRLLYITTLAISCGLGSVTASEFLDSVEDNREVGERMAFDCLSGDRPLECLKEKGFECASVGDPSRSSYSCYISLVGGCYRKRFQLEENGWSSNDEWGSGECEHTFEPTLEPGIRKKFDNTNAPSELVFQFFVRGIFAEVLEYVDNLDTLDDGQCHDGLRYVEPGLTAKMKSVDVVRYFAKRYISIEQEVEDLSKMLLCMGKRPRYDGAENFQIFNQLDDVRLNVYERHLLLARADLQVSGLFDLDKALRDYPGSFVSVFTDHEASRDGSIPMIYEHATRLCKDPWKHNFSSSQPVSEDKIEVLR